MGGIFNFARGLSSKDGVLSPPSLVCALCPTSPLQFSNGCLQIRCSEEQAVRVSFTMHMHEGHTVVLGRKVGPAQSDVRHVHRRCLPRCLSVTWFRLVCLTRGQVRWVGMMDMMHNEGQDDLASFMLM